VTLYEGNVAEYLDRLARLEQERLDRKKKKGEIRNGPEVEEKSGAVSRESRKEKRKQEALKRQRRSRKIGPYRKKLIEAEERVEKLEGEKEGLEQRMADPDLYKDEQAWSAVSKEYDGCKRRLERWYERWELAQGKIDEIDALEEA